MYAATRQGFYLLEFNIYQYMVKHTNQTLCERRPDVPITALTYTPRVVLCALHKEELRARAA